MTEHEFEIAESPCSAMETCATPAQPLTWLGEPCSLDSGAALAIANLTGCKYPIGETHEPDFRFCNAPTSGTYCEHHAKGIYAKPTRSLPPDDPRLSPAFAAKARQRFLQRQRKQPSCEAVTLKEQKR